MGRCKGKFAKRVVTGAVSAMAMGVTLAPPAAAADQPADCGWSRYTDDDDPGGSSGEVYKGNMENPRYSVQFWAKGEHLSLWDFDSDGHRAEATVYVTKPDGTFADLDRFDTGDELHANLGTPDGTGDIPEGYKVWLRIRHTGGEWCNAVYFTA